MPTLQYQEESHTRARTRDAHSRSVFTVPLLTRFSSLRKPAPYRNDSSLGAGGPSHWQRIAGCLVQTLLQLFLPPFLLFVFVVVVVCKCLTLVRVCDEKSARATVHVWAPGAYCYPSCCSSVLCWLRAGRAIIIESLTLQKLRRWICFALVTMNHWPFANDFTHNKCTACISMFQSAKVVTYGHLQCLWQVQVAIACLPVHFVAGSNRLLCTRNLQWIMSALAIAFDILSDAVHSSGF